jgi:hypothetical protein
MQEFKLKEAIYSTIGNIVDPCEDLYDPETGERWQLCGGSQDEKNRCRDAEWYDNQRCVGRWLTSNNGWALNVQDNRVSYIVGSGHRYDISPINKEDESSKAAAVAANLTLNEFMVANNWGNRQQNNQERLDRDGDVFIRITKSNGSLSLRYVEPEHVKTPDALKQDKNVRMGIRYKEGDAETVEGYYVWTSDTAWELVPAKEIQHRKRGVDLNDDRGISLYWSISKNLVRADKLLRNSSILVELQTAIGLIRKHSGSKSEVQSFRNDSANYSATNSATGNTRYGKRYTAGTILDAPQGVEYDFPAQSLNVANYKGVTQAELRAVSSRVIMPEYMVTADASNSAYASTLVAEGPAVKNFEKQQAQMMAWDLELFDMVFDVAVEEGRMSDEDRQLIKINVTPPRTQVRDRKADVEADEILRAAGVMSKQTMAEKNNLEPEEEKQRMEAETDSEFNIVPDGVEDEDEFG